MGHLALFVEHWGYAAIFMVVVLGNIGLPVPEETILTLAGYLVWRGDLRLWPVLMVGIASVSAGDNFAYWSGRSLGSAAVRRFRTRLWVTCTASKRCCRRAARRRSNSQHAARIAIHPASASSTGSRGYGRVPGCSAAGRRRGHSAASPDGSSPRGRAGERARTVIAIAGTT